jgi:hypothetical protein
MTAADLASLRRKAEEAVSDMSEGPLKLKAFEVILQNLLRGQPRPTVSSTAAMIPDTGRAEAPSSLAARVLAEEGFFSEPRSLGEIQHGLAEHGWHYPQTNLSTPLVRLVKQRRLRRLQLADGNKRVWKYSLP